jgi:hypothetical protein
VARRRRIARRHLPDDARGVVLKLDAAHLDALVWTFVFGGFLVVGLGISLQRGGAPYGWAVAVVGAFLVGAGVVFLWLRSRIPESKS